MKLASKLPLAFALAVLLVLAAAMFGIFQLNASLQVYGTTVKAAREQHSHSDDLALQFKTQVQEWKNTLLRGKDPKALDKHWQAFGKAEQDVAARAQRLLAELPQGPSRVLVQQFASAHEELGRNYRKGFEAFKAAGLEAPAGDAAVRGMDREPTRLLDEASEAIAAFAEQTASAAAEAGGRATRISIGLMLAVCAAAIVGAVLFSRSITRPIARAVAAAETIAAGDLARPIEVRGGDETAQLLAAMAAMQTALQGVVGSVRQNAEQVATASSQIAAGNLALSQRTEEQASALQQTAASMEQLGSSVHHNAASSQRAHELAREASSVAVRGGDVVGQVVETMKGINDSSRRIADIIGVIDGIAFQTNILALNAAVEAARAGEQGRGFAVVASEVRSLAGRSAGAAKEIKSLIGDSVSRVERGSALVDEAGSTMAAVVAAIQRVSAVVGEISDATQQQNTGMAQVGEAVAQIDQTTQQNAAQVEEAAAAAESLRLQAQQLAQAVAVFRLGAEGPLAA